MKNQKQKKTTLNPLKLILVGLFFSNLLFSQSVNEFTGDFSYSVPLISIPCPYGPPVTISASYGAGIGVNQSSSEIGLGWGINAAGLISRNVSGVPDDWDGQVVADPSLGGFKSQGGLLYFKNGNVRDNLDFYKSTYKIDTPAFYFPNYDYYSISAPGIVGSLQPHLFDFATTELNVPVSGTPQPPSIPYKIDPVHPFSTALQFNFGGDYGGDFKSRHYSSTPINGSTTLRLPGSKISDAESGYTADSTPYAGINNIGYNSGTNRLATARYVTYTESNGITGFVVTDESGFIYKFNKPVKINYSVFGKYPLRNDYSLRPLDTTRVTDGNGNYYIKENTVGDANNPYMVEWRQNSAYNYNWLLTEILGPNYVDNNSNNVADAGDAGYWVSYDWQLWTSNFTRRTPEYGFDYSYEGDESEKTIDDDTISTLKIHGKFATFSKYNQELYYLNKIQTSSHTALFVRDVRLDNYSSDLHNYDNQASSTFNIDQVNGQTKTNLTGTLYDSGGPSGNYTGSTNYTVTISPTSASSITIRFPFFNMASGDVVKILDGSNNILVTYSSTNLPPSNGATFSYSTIKINQTTTGNAPGFRLGWTSTVHTTVVPQLKLSRILLFKNEDFSTLNLPSSSSNYYVTTSVSGFDVTSSGIGKDKFFNETWYNHVNNKTNIEAKSIQTIEFNQDYSLAKKYVNNIKTFVCATDKNSPPYDVVKGCYVASADNATSGKLTLNEITTYEVGHQKTSPSIIFDYNKDISNDNPDYNPVKIDYWGFYKSDATDKGYSSYTTPTSKDFTSAWSLRKITSPMGGTIEINYESNQYEKVLSGTGGFRGPSKMYALKSVSNPSGCGQQWTFEMEEGAATISDYDALRTSPPSGTVKKVLIPYIEQAVNNKHISYGTFNFSSSTVINQIQEQYTSPISSISYMPNGGFYCSSNNFKYTGNGYINFQLPVGSAVYGGGIRVKSIVSKNGVNDSYTQEYLYYEGVTPMEADRFGEEKLVVNGGVSYYNKLRPTAYDKHRMGPGIGYSKVIVKNKGQNNSSKGSVVYKFITTDANIDNFKANVERRITNNVNHYVGGVGTCPNGTLNDTAYMVEVIDKFSGYWGQLSEVQLLDLNDNILSKTKNEYVNLTQGSIVEKYDFVTKKNYTTYSGSDNLTCAEHHHIVSILRSYPVVLSKQTIYNQEVNSTTEYLAFDPITRTPTMVRSTTPNKGITVTRSTPAFRISQYSAMGPKSVTSSNANIVSPVAYQKVTVDSTITTSSDFAEYSIQTFKKDLYIRKYDVSNNKFINDLQTNVYWVEDRSYSWAGGSSSIDDYGLYKQSELTSTPFDYTLASIDSKWRFNSENTLFDKSGHVIEIKGFNNRFSAKKYGYGDTLLTAEAANVNHASFTFAGFESSVKDLDPGAGVANYIDGEIKINNAVKITSTPSLPSHTGNYLLKVPSGTTGSNSPTFSVKYISSSPNSGLLKDRLYRASVWVHSSSPSGCQMTASFTGGASVSVTKSSTSNIVVGDWILMNLDIIVGASPNDGDELKIILESASGDAYFDDFRLHPVDAIVSSVVYEPKTNRIIATLDENNFATVYKYDAGGRVLEVWKEIENVGLKRLKKYQYNYSRGTN